MLKTLTAVAATVAAAFTLLPGPANATGPTLACTSTASTSSPLVCTLSGTAPDGRKITYTNPTTHKTINVANASIIPASLNEDGSYTLSYVPSAGEAGRLEVLSVPYDCSRLGCRSSAYAYFQVTSA